MLHAWLAAWWRHHGRRRPMFIEAAFKDDELVAGIPIEVHRAATGIRASHFMGRYHAALADVLVRQSEDDPIARCLVSRVRRRADYVDLFGLSRGSVVLRMFANEGRAIRRVGAPVLDLTPGWAEVYRTKTSSKRRNLHQRRRRQLAELGDVSFSMAYEEAELSAALEEAFRLHDLRWLGRPDGSEFTTPVGRAFHRDAVRALAREGIPRIALLSVDGTPVAFHFYLLFANTMYVHQLAFDPAYGKYSPGLLATLEAIGHAASEDAQRVEFLGGDERYKIELADEDEPLYEYIGLASTLRGRMGAAGTIGLIETRLRLKNSPWLQRWYLRGGKFRRAARSARGKH